MYSEEELNVRKNNLVRNLAENIVIHRQSLEEMDVKLCESLKDFYTDEELENIKRDYKLNANIKKESSARNIQYLVDQLHQLYPSYQKKEILEFYLQGMQAQP